MPRTPLSRVTLLMAVAAGLALATAPGTAGAAPSGGGAWSLLPPGESGTFLPAAQARYELDHDPADFGPHVDDQRAPYWSGRLRDAAFTPPTGTPETPRPGVRIYRDALGVPAVYADRGQDLWFGAGYAAAEDRLFELDGVRRTARGTLAELTGPGGVPADVQERVLTPTVAEDDAALARLSPAARDALTGYAAGVEARIAEVRSNPALLPAEYVVLQTLPADWSVEDTLAVGVYVTRLVASQGGQELDDVAALRALESRYGVTAGRRAFDELLPLEDPRAATTIHGTRFSNVPPADRSPAARARAYARAAAAAERLPGGLDAGDGTGAHPVPAPVGVTTSARAAVLDRLSTSLERWRRSLHGGSFAYAVRGSHVAGGGAALVSNPQLDYSYPSLLYGVEVHGAGYDARGVSVPGIPTVGIGRTATVAWGLTTGYSKTVDSFVETTRANPNGGPRQYLHDGRWVDESCRTEDVRYRAKAGPLPVGPALLDEPVTICRTVHGPVVATSSDGVHQRTVDYAIAGHEVDTIEGILRLDRARTLRDVAAAVPSLTWNENLVAADAGGHIGYWHPGRYFRRSPGGDQRFPLDGRGTQDERGLLTPAEMPHVVDPPEGYVVNWNTKPALGWVDGDLSGTTTRPAGPLNRVDDLQGALARSRGLTESGLLAIDLAAGRADHRASGYAPLLASPQVRAALGDVLRGWDGRAYAPGAGSSPAGTPAGSVTDGPAATAFVELTQQLKRHLFGGLPELVRARLDTLPVESHRYDALALDNLALRVLRPGYSGLPEPAILGRVGVRAVLAAAARDARAALVQRYGADPAGWRRPHAVSHLDSLTGVVGPSATEPFEDRGSWVQHVVFPGRPVPARPRPVRRHRLPRTGWALPPAAGLLALAARGRRRR